MKHVLVVFSRARANNCARSSERVRFDTPDISVSVGQRIIAPAHQSVARTWMGFLDTFEALACKTYTKQLEVLRARMRRGCTAAVAAPAERRWPLCLPKWLPVQGSYTYRRGARSLSRLRSAPRRRLVREVVIV